jgi:hypothetical protein
MEYIGVKGGVTADHVTPSVVLSMPVSTLNTGIKSAAGTRLRVSRFATANPCVKIVDRVRPVHAIPSGEYAIESVTGVPVTIQLEAAVAMPLTLDIIVETF